MNKFAKSSFYDNIGDLIDYYYSRDPKNYWKLVKRRIGDSGSESIPTLIDLTSGLLSVDDKEKANLLNGYFCRITNIDNNNSEVPMLQLKTNSVLNNLLVTSNELCDVF